MTLAVICLVLAALTGAAAVHLHRTRADFIAEGAEWLDDRYGRPDSDGVPHEVVASWHHTTYLWLFIFTSALNVAVALDLLTQP